MANIFQKGISWFKKLGTGNIIKYGLIVVLAAVVLFQSKCSSKKLTVAECETAKKVYGDSLKAEFEKTVFTETSITTGNPALGDTIVKEVIKWRNHSTFVRNWEELQRARKEKQDLIDQLNRALATLNITKEELDSAGVVEVQTVVKTEELPIIKTIKDEKGENYEIKENIWSRGQLEDYTRSVMVRPKTITITEVQHETLKRKNHLSFKFGALYLDAFDNYYFVPGVGYSRKALGFEASPILDKDLKYRGAEGKVTLTIRW